MPCSKLNVYRRPRWSGTGGPILQRKKILIQAIGSPNKLPSLLNKLHRTAEQDIYEIVEDPSSADLIIFCASFGSWTGPGLAASVKAHPLIRKYPQKCAAYSEDPCYLPLIPGIYTSATKGFSTRTGRAVTYAYITRHVQLGNPYTVAANCHIEKDLLFSFQGASTAFVRKRLFKLNFNRRDVLIEDTSSHRNWFFDSRTESRQKIYVETIRRSHFVLCPRGSGAGSFRLFEVMRMGAAPVLISDNYVLPTGPNWESFLIRVPERRIAELPAILDAHRAESAERGQHARDAWVQWFDTGKEFNQIIARSQEALNASARFEWLYRASWNLQIARFHALWWLRRKARSLAFSVVRLLGIKFPYSLRGNDPVPFDPMSITDDLGESAKAKLRFEIIEP